MISTPINPAAVASQRRKPTFSARKKIDSAVTSNGDTKAVAEASAMGRNLKPEIKNSDEPSSATPRMTCIAGRWVRSANNGEPGTIAGTMMIRKIRNRIQAISIDGSVAERYFEVASDVPRKMPDNRSNAIPRNGRSTRVGATFFAGFSSGSANSALSSLKAAAGRVTV